MPQVSEIRNAVISYVLCTHAHTHSHHLFSFRLPATWRFGGGGWRRLTLALQLVDVRQQDLLSLVRHTVQHQVALVILHHTTTAQQPCSRSRLGLGSAAGGLGHSVQRQESHSKCAAWTGTLRTWHHRQTRSRELIIRGAMCKSHTAHVTM